MKLFGFVASALALKAALCATQTIYETLPAGQSWCGQSGKPWCQTLSECQTAGSILGLGWGATSSSWTAWPGGCFRIGDKVYWNVQPIGVSNPEARPICHGTAHPGDYKLSVRGTNVCPQGFYHMRSAVECQVAGRSLSPPLTWGQSHTWDKWPKGCFKVDGEMNFNTHAVGAAYGTATPICQRTMRVYGRWHKIGPVGSGGMEYTLTHGWGNTASESHSSEWSSEVTQSVTASLGVEGVGGVSTSASATMRTAMAESFSQEWTSQGSTQFTFKASGSDEGKYVFQWKFDATNSETARHVTTISTIAMAVTQGTPQCYPSQCADKLACQSCKPGGELPGLHQLQV